MKLPLLALLATTTLALAQNAVIFGNATFYGGHADGQLLIAGNALGTNYELNQHNTSPVAMYLGGSNNTINFLRANQGSSMIVGNKGNYQGSLTTIPTPDFAYYAGYSNTLQSYTTNSTFTNSQNNVVLNLGNAVNVFSVNASEFSGYKTLDFTGSGIVVFNVTGDLDNWGWNVNYDPNKIIWNFVDAQTININNRQFTGSIIAPNADVYQYQNINGMLVADNWTVYNSAELHNYTVPTNLVPEPTVALLGAIGILTMLKRRR